MLTVPRPVRHDVERPAKHRDHDLHVVGVAVVVHADVGLVEGVGAGEDDLALAVGLHRIGEDDHGLGVGGETRVGVVEVLVRVDPQAAAPDVVGCSRR